MFYKQQLQIQKEYIERTKALPDFDVVALMKQQHSEFLGREIAKHVPFQLVEQPNDELELYEIKIFAVPLDDWKEFREVLMKDCPHEIKARLLALERK